MSQSLTAGISIWTFCVFFGRSIPWVSVPDSRDIYLNKLKKIFPERVASQSLTAGISIWTKDMKGGAKWLCLSPWQQGYLFEPKHGRLHADVNVSVPDSRDIYLNRNLAHAEERNCLSPWQQGYLFEHIIQVLSMPFMSQSLTAGISIWTIKTIKDIGGQSLSPWQQGYLFERVFNLDYHFALVSVPDSRDIYLNLNDPRWEQVEVSQSLTAGISIWTVVNLCKVLKLSLSPWQQGYLFERS